MSYFLRFVSFNIQKLILVRMSVNIMVAAFAPAIPSFFFGNSS